MISDNYFNWQGGKLPIDSPTYVERKADEELYQFGKTFHKSNRVFFLLAPRQRGKSTTTERVAVRLKHEGIACVSINFQGFSKIPSNFEDKFWYTLTFRICKALSSSNILVSSLDKFWEKNKNLLPSECFYLFLANEILAELEDYKLVIFLDEVQSLIKLGISDDFIRCIRAISEDVNNEVLQRVSFVLIGVAKPSEFAIDSDTNLNIGLQTELGYLTGNCLPLQKGLQQITSEPKRLLERVFYWTSGQPFLTQFICHLLVEESGFGIGKDLERYVDNLVTNQIIEVWRVKDPQSHFQGIENLFLKIDSECIQSKLLVLNSYENLLNKGEINWERGNEIHADLLMTGLAIKHSKGNKIYLKVANQIYEYSFNYEWIDEIRKRLAGGKLMTQDHLEDWMEEEEDIQPLSNSAVVKKGLKILAKGLRPFVDKHLSEHLGKGWKNRPEVRKITRPSNDPSQITYLDSQKILKLMANNWNDVFSRMLSKKQQNWVYELLTTRNEEAHEEEFDDRMTLRALDTIECLLRAIGSADEATTVEGIKMNKFPSMMKNSQDNAEDNTVKSEQLEVLPSEESLEREVLASPEFQLKTDERKYSDMDRSIRIASIIDKRRPRAEKVESTISTVQSFSSHLQKMDSYRNNLFTKVDEVSVIEKLRELPFHQVQQQIQKTLEVFVKLRRRYSRDSLTIAFVGRAGQGKSLFIQTLTGLTSVEIPEGSTHNCTGVPVTISHSPNGQTVAEVYFHTQDSFLKDNIHPYYDYLGLGTKPTTLAEFTNNPLPQLQRDNSEAKALYGHLEKCHTHYSSYSSLLQESSPKRITREEIRPFVAQTNDANERTYFNYLAVKEVKIFCNFPHGDVGKITLIDFPGLGDTVLGDRERLRRGLGQDVDLAFFVYRPSGRIWQEEDYKLYDTANAALPELPIKKWSIFILNRVDNPKTGSGVAENKEQCEEAKRQLEAEGRIQVAKCIIANCANPQEASDVLNQGLDYLETHILELDAEYAAIANMQLKQLQNDISTFVQKASQAFAVAPKYGNETTAFWDFFDEFDIAKNRGLFQLQEELRPDELDVEYNKKDAEIFQAAVNAMIQKCYEDTGIPSKEELEEEFLRSGGGQGSAIVIFAKSLDIMRNHLTGHFSAFDSGLQEYVNLTKKQIADIFTQTDLGNLTPVRGIDFLDFMADEIPPYCTALKSGFEYIVSFDMSSQTHFEYKVLKPLSELDPKTHGQVFTEKNKSQEQLIDKIQQVLTVFHRKAVCACQVALEKFEGEPSLAVYAAVRKFVDKVARSKNVEKEWEAFMRERSSQIWPNQFGQAVGQEKKEWMQMLEKISTMNKIETI